MKRLTYTMMMSMSLIGLFGVGAAEAGQRDDNNSRLNGAKSPYNQTVKAETFTINHPKIVLGGVSGRMGTDSTQAWWVNRNDNRMNIRKDSNRMEVVNYVVYTHDRQSHSGTRINDSYRRTVRQVRYGQQVR